MTTYDLMRSCATLNDEEKALLVALIRAYRPNHLLQVRRGEMFDLSAEHANACGDFDFVFVDGETASNGYPLDFAIADILPFLEQDAYILIHHAAHHRVAAAIDAALAAHPDELIDCGLVGRGAIWDTAHQAHYGGLRLLRYVRRRRLTVWQEGA